MNARFEIVRVHENSSLRCKRSTGEKFASVWHYHPEFEFMYVQRSHGMRFVGDTVEPFTEGDLVLVGPNLPHMWVNRDVPRRPRHDHAIGTFVQFREDFLGSALWQTPEFAAVAVLLRQGRYGVHFTGPEVLRAGAHLQRMWETTGVERVTELLRMLELLAHSPHQRILCRAGYVPALNRTDARRIQTVCRYIDRRLTSEISQPAVAAQVRLSSAQFARFFRLKMRCKFTTYVNQLRVAHVTRLLTEEKMSITDACFASGFNNLSNFNRQFRALKGMSPRAYLHHFRAGGTSSERALGASYIPAAPEREKPPAESSASPLRPTASRRTS